ncbi:universal stress protein [Corynebacterium lowii]|uniref:Universal stress protein family protein n=1 Tax=Corynebacterium lowii TaxID=1544413 RepID=A0A0Q1E2Y2_9CORY|nr:universal stress protein [Corynebacterium lowii]KQB86973.1 Universal stress protein family protein [Corynebacterium lowii]MDP9852447.1 nucleotide-binding universal stress UspA family protein [Corynebacterium lowii]
MVQSEAEYTGPQRILVAWNPDSPRTEALEFAAWLSHTTDVCIRVVTLFLRPWPATSLQKLGGKYRKWFDKQQRACEEAVTRALRHAQIPSRHWDHQPSVFLDGPSQHALLTEAAEDFDAHLVILGSGAAAPKGRFLANSTADAMLHSSPKALGLAPRAVKLSKHGVRRVNFAYLGTEQKDHDPSLDYAARMAAAWNTPLRILSFSPSGIADASLEGNLNLGKELAHDWREHSLAMLDRARDWIASRYSHLELESEVGTGPGWAGAVDALKWKKGDLLCLGSNPMGAIERVFVGSAATDLLPHVRVPVIVYPVPRT